MDNYLIHVVAYLIQIEYLDYVLASGLGVDKGTLESYCVDELSELREQESEQKLAAEQQKEKQKHTDDLKEYFADFTDGLLDQKLFKPGEVEPPNVKLLNAYPMLYDEFKEKFLEKLKELRNYFKQQNQKMVYK